jgi:anti-sigma regulatory factor (Ser/Thr protein kinase)
VPGLELRLPRVASSSSLARTETEGFLGAQGRPDLVPDAKIVVSELVANAVLHGADPIRLQVVVGLGVRIAVFDGDPRTEQVLARASHPSEPDGRGLCIVESLATAWGAADCDGGKLVWAALT